MERHGNGEMGRRKPPSMAEGLFKTGLGETCSAGEHGKCLCGKALAADAAAGTEDFASGAGAGALTEAVGAGALTLFRLVGSLCHSSRF